MYHTLYRRGRVWYMMRHMWGNTILPMMALGCLLAGTSSAFAQGQGGVASSGMGQGEANITTRSDVRMGVESGPGTAGRRLQAMVDAITAKLGGVRECYGQVTAERPTVTGEMHFHVTLPRSGRARLALTEDTASDRPLLRCVESALNGADFRSAMRPAEVFVDLAFGNTAARGVAEVNRRRAIEDNVRVTRNAEGRFVARGGTPGTEIRFQVLAEGSSDVAAAAQRAVRAIIPGLLDCRRRAGRRLSPAGMIALDLTVPARGRVRTRPVSSTVADSRASQCVARALRPASFGGQAGAVRLEVTFGATQALDVPTHPE